MTGYSFYTLFLQRSLDMTLWKYIYSRYIINAFKHKIKKLWFFFQEKKKKKGIDISYKDNSS